MSERSARCVPIRQTGAMRFLVPSDAQLASAVRMQVPVETGLAADELAAEIKARRLRPEWSVVATDEVGEQIGRAMWWGRDDSAPIALDVWDVAGDAPNRLDLAAALLHEGHEALAGRGVKVPLPHTLRLPNDWRAHVSLVSEVDMKVRAAASAGLTQMNERLQFQWERGNPPPSQAGSLVFAPADDDTFIRLFAAASSGSLDVLTRRELESNQPDDLARAELDFHLACPGDRSWWRTAATANGAIVGVVIPSATPTSRNIGYLAVLPEHRGNRYVDELLAFVTHFHAQQGAPRVTATTDVVNAPMAAAFRRAGFHCTETRIDLEAP